MDNVERREQKLLVNFIPRYFPALLYNRGQRISCARTDAFHNVQVGVQFVFSFAECVGSRGRDKGYGNVLSCAEDDVEAVRMEAIAPRAVGESVRNNMLGVMRGLCRRKSKQRGAATSFSCVDDDAKIKITTILRGPYA